jgi:hypothetical protein
MTKATLDIEGRGPEQLLRCSWCRRVLPPAARTGRPRKYCQQSCRQWDWVSRQRAGELSLGADELIVARSHLDALRDDLYVMACAVDDVRSDLEAPGKRTDRELRNALEWLLDAARPLRDREIAPVSA